VYAAAITSGGVALGRVAHAVSTELRISSLIGSGIVCGRDGAEGCAGGVDDDVEEEEDAALLLLPNDRERETPSLVPIRRA